MQSFLSFISITKNYYYKRLNAWLRKIPGSKTQSEMDSQTLLKKKQVAVHDNDR